MLFRSGALLVFAAAIDVHTARAQVSMPAPAGNPNALWEIVSTCFAGSQAHACACPALDRACCGEPGTPDREVVWGTTSDFVAFRDLKACGCPAGFVAGLALPRVRVTGIEDPRRPTAVWAFAWDVARARIPDEQEVALVVNPRSRRTQDQLHVHMVRLAPGARARIVGAVAISAIGEVWEAAARAAAAAKLDDYGVLVVRDGVGSGFLVMVDPNSLEEALTIGTCRR